MNKDIYKAIMTRTRLRDRFLKNPPRWIDLLITRTWHDKNIQSNAPYRWVLITQLNHLANLAKWLSVRLRTKWWWVRVPLQSLVFSLFSLLTKGSYKIREMKLQNVWNGEIFFSTNISNKSFLRETCGKQVSGKRRLLGTYST